MEDVSDRTGLAAYEEVPFFEFFYCWQTPESGCFVDLSFNNSILRKNST